MSVKVTDFCDVMSDSFLKYAFSVVIGRSIPDFRDGLKPVHRRVLQSCNVEGIRSTSPCKKAARLVGACLGRFHPHGDASVYDAAIRLAQPWKMNVPLMDSQGNIGSIHGDSSAAMRYVEMRSAAVCEYIFKDLKKETVPWSPTYDSSDVEPMLLPIHFPNLLINGASGMAVGYATDIPPHNPKEAIDACLLLLKKPDATLDEVMKVIPSPDFPTGGLIINPSEIRNAYATGKGNLRVRAPYEVKDRSRGASSIIYKTIPYGTSTDKIREKVAELAKDKRIQVTDCRDESDKKNYRLVVDVPNGVSPETTAALLYQLTPLESTVKINLNGIINDGIKQVGIIEMLNIFLEFRRGVVINRTSYELREFKSRKHIVEGLIKSCKGIDEVIKIVRAAESKDAASVKLQEKFELTERQAEAVLAMRISQLTKLNINQLKEENTSLESSINQRIDILKTKEYVDDIISDELKAASNSLKRLRLTEVSSVDVKKTVGDEALAVTIVEEDVVITISTQGYLKRIPQSAFTSQGRGGKGRKGMKARKDDMIERILQCSSHDDLLLFTDTGRVFSSKAFRIPESTPDKVGSHASAFLAMKDGEKVVEVIPVKKLGKKDSVIICTANNKIKRTAAEEYTDIRPSGVIAIKLEDKDKILSAFVGRDADEVFVGTSEGKSLRFPVANINPTNRTTMGVMAINVAKGEKIVNCTIVPKKTTCQVIAISNEGNGKKMDIEDFPTASRGCKGVLAMSRRPNTKMVYLGTASDEDKGLIITTSEGICIRIRLEDVASLKRVTKGSRLIRLTEGDSIMSVTTTTDEIETDVEEGEE
jgi:DNA gyrase subunit A